MYYMLTNFLIISILYIIAEATAVRWFYLLIQEGAPIDVLFKYLTGTSYQDMLKNLYGSQKVWKNNLGKALGDCQMCLSFWFPVVCFACYGLFCRLILKYWVSDEVQSTAAAVFVNILWYIAIHSISGFIGWIVLQKVTSKKKKSDAV